MGLAGTEKQGEGAPLGSAFFYASVRDLLAGKIRSGELPAGTVLKEAPISGQLGMSRAPVRRALILLAEDGLITPAAGQGCCACVPCVLWRPGCTVWWTI